jgi:4-carboxymuconolactone decarboxylase
MTRLPMLESDEIPEEYHYLFTEEYLGDRHIFRVWAHSPEVLKATLEYLDSLYEQLTPRRKELVILAVARARGARYEWHQHVDIARDEGEGVTTEEMRAIGGGDLSPFDEDEFVLLQYARAVSTGDVTDQVHSALRSRYEPGQVVAVGLIVDFYVGLCNYVAATDLPFEGGEFVGWTPSDKKVKELFE